MEKCRNEWTRTLRITEYEACDEEDYDIEQFLPPGKSLGDQEMVTGWEKENTSSDCDSSEDDNCSQDVDNNRGIKEKTEYKQVSDKSSVSEEKEESCQASSKRGIKRLCPLKGCKSQVIDLPRHLREVHNWSREKAQKATSKFGMQKSSSSKVVEKGKENKGKDYHHHRKCPVLGCYSTVKRLSHHLQQVHKEIRKGLSEYKGLLKEARSIKPWRSSSLSNHGDNSSKARKKVKEDDRNGSNTQGPGSGSDAGGYEDKSDSEREGEAASTSSVETSHGIFGTFANWLQTADGGRKPEKMSKQHASQVNKMLAVIDPNKDLASIFDKKLIHDTFLKNHAENAYKPDTIKSYLLCLRYFCSFVLTENPDAVNVNEATVHLR